MRTVNTARNKPKPSKIQQQVTVNKVQQSGTVTPTSPTTNAVTTHTTRSAHATQIPVKTRPQVTSINTEPRLTPLGRVGLGVYNTGSDYANILNTDYEDKSILNQAIGHAFEGKWDKAGQVIQENPYRFAGNLIVEAGTNLIPLGAIMKVAKVVKVTDKIIKSTKQILPKKTINGEEVRTLYQVTNTDAPSNMWFSQVPEGFYHDKITSGVSNIIAKTMGATGKHMTPEIRAVDVPLSVFNKYKVSYLTKTGAIEGTPAGSNSKKMISFANIPDRHLRDRTTTIGQHIPIKENLKNSPKYTGEHPTTDFIAPITKQTNPNLSDFAIKNKNEQLQQPIGAITKLASFSPNKEWVLKLHWQNKTKVLATAGENESLVRRIFNPRLTRDKYVNTIVSIHKKSGRRRVLNKNSRQFDDDIDAKNHMYLDKPIQKGTAWVQSGPFKQADDIMKIKNDLIYTSTMLMIPGAVSSISKGQAAGEGYGRRFNNEIKKDLHGYEQFL